MRKMQLVRNFTLLSLSVIGALMVTGCANMSDSYVRTYYQDSHGRYFVDNLTGQRVYLYGSYYRGNTHAPYCHRDCHGRYYSKDSYGNLYYYNGYGRYYR